MRMLNQRTTLSLRSSENPTNSRLIVLKPRFGANVRPHSGEQPPRETLTGARWR